MSDSIPAPWISDYLVDMAETYGGDLGAIPRREKPGRAQLVKFLTFLRPEDEDSCIWARLSDKSYIVPARFSSEAIKIYKLDRSFRGKSLTEHKSALILIKSFRPMFARVPLGRGMSASEELFLDVQEFSLKGSFDEDIWGSPRDVSAHAKLQDWMNGLRKGGGDGNVLKLRKQERQAQLAASSEGNLKQPESGVGPRQSGAKIASPRKTAPKPAKRSFSEKDDSPKAYERSSRPGTRHAHQDANVDPRKAYERSWRYIYSSTPRRKRALPPTDILDAVHKAALEAIRSASIDGDVAGSSTPPKRSRPRRDPLDLTTSPPESPLNAQSPVRPPSPAQETMPQTPSHWSQTDNGSPNPLDLGDAEPDKSSDTDEDTDPATDHASSPRARKLMASMEATLVDDSEYAQSPSKGIKAFDLTDAPVSSYLSGPTPAQRQKRVPSSSPVPDAPSTPPIPEAAAAGSPSLPTPESDSCVFDELGRQNLRERRVLVPRARRPLRDMNSSFSVGRVLVPNSDTSGGGSQSQSQSQSQSRPYSQPEPSRFLPNSSQLQSQSEPQSQAQPSPRMLPDSSRLRSQLQPLLHLHSSPVIPSSSDLPQRVGPLPAEAFPPEKPSEGKSQSQSQGEQSARTHQSLSYVSQSSREKGESQDQIEEGSQTRPKSQLCNEVEVAPSNDQLLPPESAVEAVVEIALEEASSTGATGGRTAAHPPKKVPAAEDVRVVSRAALPSSPMNAVDGNDSVTEEEDADDELDEDDLGAKTGPSRGRRVQAVAEEEEESQIQAVAEEEEESQVPVIVEQEEESQEVLVMPDAEDKELQNVPSLFLVEEAQGVHDQLDIVASDAESSDSDDASVIAMVEARLEEKARALSSDQHTPTSSPAKYPQAPIKRRPTRSSMHDDSSDGPLRPSSPDVFLSEASFNASQDIPQIKPSCGVSFAKSKPATVASSASSSKQTSARPFNTANAPATKAPASPQPVYHFPGAWRAPAFQLVRSDNKGKEKASLSPESKAARKQSVAASKRPIEDVSSLESPPPKKQKMRATPSVAVTAASSKDLSRRDQRHDRTSTSTMPYASSVADSSDHDRPQLPSSSSSRHVAASSTRLLECEMPLITSSLKAQVLAFNAPTNGQIRGQLGESTVLKTDFLQNGTMASSTSLTKRKRTEGAEQPIKASTPKPEIRSVQKLSPGGSASYEIKQVNFSSRESSRSSSIKRIKKEVSQVSKDALSRRHVLPSVSIDTQADEAPARQPQAVQETEETVAPCREPAPSHHSGQVVEHSQASSLGVVQSMKSEQDGGPSVGAPATQGSSRLLGGYEIDFNMVRTRDGPPLVTWHALSDILLQTGQIRSRASKVVSNRDSKGSNS